MSDLPYNLYPDVSGLPDHRPSYKGISEEGEGQTQLPYPSQEQPEILEASGEEEPNVGAWVVDPNEGQIASMVTLMGRYPGKSK